MARSIAAADEDHLYTLFLAWHNAPEWDWMERMVDARLTQLSQGLAWRAEFGPHDDYCVPTSAVLIHDCGAVLGCTPTDDPAALIAAHEQVCPQAIGVQR